MKPAASNRALARATSAPILGALKPILRSLLAVGCVLPFVFGAGCSRDSASGHAAEGKGNPGVQDGGSFALRPVESRRIERAITVTGSLLPIDQTPISVKVPGRIATLAVDLGSFVRQGEPIAQVEDVDYRLRVRQAEAALNQARARLGLPLDAREDQVDVESSSAVREARAVLDEARANRDRIAALSRQGILSTSELETASATFKVAQSRYQEATEAARTLVAQLQQRRAEYEIAVQDRADTLLVAPFDGAVQERRANVGEYLSVGAPVVVFVRVDPLRLRVEVAEREAGRVRIGQPVQVSVEGDTNVYTGEVKRLSPAIQQGSRTLVVEADVPSQGRLRPGSFARARIITLDGTPAWIVPPEALVTFAGIEKVFLVRDGSAVEQRVTTGDRGADWVELRSGVREGDIVVLNPGSLQAGQRVHPRPEPVGATAESPAPAPAPTPPPPAPTAAAGGPTRS